MATITALGDLDGTEFKSVLTLTEKSRTENQVTFNVTIETNITTSTGWIGSGNSERLIGTIDLSGNNVTKKSQNFNVKTATQSWEGTSVHKITGTMTLNVSTNEAVNVNIKYTLEHTGSGDTISKTGSIKTSVIYLNSKLNAINDFNVESDVTISITKYKSEYFDKLVVKCFDTIIKTINDIDDGYTLTFNEEELATIYELMQNTNSTKFSFDLTTYKNESLTEQIGSVSKQSPNGFITDANPIFSGFTYKDINTKTLTLTGSNQIIIKSYSDVEITTNTVITQKGAVMDHFTINERLVNLNEIPFTIEGITSQEIVIYAVDSRGNSTPIRKVIENWIEYENLGKGNGSANRDNGTSTQAKINIDGTYSNINFGAVNNNIEATYKYKNTKDDEWQDGLTEIIVNQENGRFSFNDYIKGDSEDNGFLQENSYDIQVIVNDKLSSITYDLLLDFGTPAIALYGNKVALGGKFDEDLDFDVQLWNKACLNRNPLFNCFNGSIIETITNTNPSQILGGKWELIKSEVIDTGWQDFSWVNTTYINQSQDSYTKNKWRIKDNILYVQIGAGSTANINIGTEEEIARVPIKGNISYESTDDRIWTGAVGAGGTFGGFGAKQETNYFRFFLKPHTTTNGTNGKWFSSFFVIPLDDDFEFTSGNYEKRYVWKRIS